MNIPNGNYSCIDLKSIKGIKENDRVNGWVYDSERTGNPIEFNSDVIFVN